MADPSNLDLTWRILLYLIDHDFRPVTNTQMAKALGGTSRSSVSRAVDALLAGKILERTDTGDLEIGLFLAQAYARRLRFWAERHEKLGLVHQAMGAELAILTGLAAEKRGEG